MARPVTARTRPSTRTVGVRASSTLRASRSMAKRYQALWELPIPAGECDALNVMRKQLIGAIAALGVVAACKASVEAEAHTSAQVATEGETSGPDEGSDGAEAQAFGEASDQGSSELALAGARPDLNLANPRAATACRCLAVAVGQPNDPLFAWQSGAPTTDPATQAVVALSSEGSSCGEGPGASYWGYRREGEDVVVLVENVRVGRPVIQGAIVPRPQGSGQILVRPLTRQVPYGGSPDGSGSCVLRFPANR